MLGLSVVWALRGATLLLYGCDEDVLIHLPPGGVSAIYCSCTFALAEPILPGIAGFCDRSACFCAPWSDPTCQDRGGTADNLACQTLIAEQAGACRGTTYSPDVIDLPLLDRVCPMFDPAACRATYAAGNYCTGTDMGPYENRAFCGQICLDLRKTVDWRMSLWAGGYECGMFGYSSHYADASTVAKECAQPCEPTVGCRVPNWETCNFVSIPTAEEMPSPWPEAGKPPCNEGYVSTTPFCRLPDQDPPALDAGGYLAVNYSRRTAGTVNATLSSARAEIAGEVVTTPVRGEFDLLGEPCVGCPLSFAVRLEAGPLRVGSRSIDRIQLSGGTGTRPVLATNAAGDATVAPGVFSGTQVLQIDGVPGYLAGANLGTLFLNVDREAGAFLLSGDVAFQGSDASYAYRLDVVGSIINHPPVADAGDDQSLECTSIDGALVHLTGDVHDRDGYGDLRQVVWLRGDMSAPEDIGRFVDNWYTTTVLTPLGRNPFTLHVSDSHMQEHWDTTHVDVIDTTPPVLTEFAYRGPACLWAPNHDYVVLRVDRDFDGMIEDACDPAPQLKIMAAGSSQPDNQSGDGATTQDVVVFPDHVCLRAERDGREPMGREYTIHLAAVDAAGNENDPVVHVRVHHDQRPPDTCGTVMRNVELVGAGDPLCSAVSANTSRAAAGCSGILGREPLAALCLLLLLTTLRKRTRA